VDLPRDGVAACHHQLSGMVVNSYLVWDPSTRLAAVFDTGEDSTPIFNDAKRRSLKIVHIFLTHSHGDHVGGLGPLQEATKAVAHSSALEPVSGTETFKPGSSFTVGNLQIETRLTRGHSIGGTTYVVRGLDRPLAVVGDALFAGSMGGAMVSYADALKTNREQIFTLEDETIILPGHGPVTTVGLEKMNNPFFAR
jgi:hydroxyacylglutathione hydrolase